MRWLARNEGRDSFDHINILVVNADSAMYNPRQGRHSLEPHY